MNIRTRILCPVWQNNKCMGGVFDCSDREVETPNDAIVRIGAECLAEERQ